MVIGGTVGLLGPQSGIIKTMTLEFGAGFIGNSANQLISTENINVKQALISATTTSIGAGAFSVGGNITSSGLEKIALYSIKGFNAGALGNIANQLLTKDIKNFDPFEALTAGGIGSLVSPVIGTVTEKTINKLEYIYVTKKYPFNEKTAYFGPTGNSSDVRIMKGGLKKSEQFYKDITKGYIKQENVSDNKAIKIKRTLSDGTIIMHRNTSKSKIPAVDINKGNKYTQQKIHFID